jgi:pilus assembly protein Flp/PilA
MKILIALLESPDGATAIEYALIASFISIAVISAVTTVGTKLVTSYNNIADNISAAR